MTKNDLDIIERRRKNATLVIGREILIQKNVINNVTYISGQVINSHLNPQLRH